MRVQQIPDEMGVATACGEVARVGCVLSAAPAYDPHSSRRMSDLDGTNTGMESLDELIDAAHRVLAGYKTFAVQLTPAYRQPRPRVAQIIVQPLPRAT